LARAKDGLTVQGKAATAPRQPGYCLAKCEYLLVDSIGPTTGIKSRDEETKRRAQEDATSCARSSPRSRLASSFSPSVQSLARRSHSSTRASKAGGPLGLTMTGDVGSPDVLSRSRAPRALLTANHVLAVTGSRQAGLPQRFSANQVAPACLDTRLSLQGRPFHSSLVWDPHRARARDHGRRGRRSDSPEGQKGRMEGGGCNDGVL
jgi:hypothetical protein